MYSKDFPKLTVFHCILLHSIHFSCPFTVINSACGCNILLQRFIPIYIIFYAVTYYKDFSLETYCISLHCIALYCVVFYSTIFYFITWPLCNVTYDWSTISLHPGYNIRIENSYWPVSQSIWIWWRVQQAKPGEMVVDFVFDIFSSNSLNNALIWKIKKIEL